MAEEMTNRTRAEVEQEMQEVSDRIFQLEQDDPEGNGSPEEDRMRDREMELTKELDAIIEQEQTTETIGDPPSSERKARVHGNTVLGANLSLKRGAISEESHAAVLAGELPLQAAKDLGPENGPDGPITKPEKAKGAAKKEPKPCLCGCGLETASTWRPGHDARLPGLVLRSLKGEVELTDEQREHAERRDLFARAEAKIAKEREKAAKARGKGEQ